MPGFGLAPEVYLPLSRTLLPGLDHPHAAAAQLVGRLKPGVGIDQAAAALDTVVQRRRLEDPDRPRHLGEMTPVTSGLHGLGSISSFFAVLVVVGGLVLGIACANVAGLLLARNTVRQKELALRAALGASRARVAQQLFVESIWLAVLGTVTGVLFMVLAMAVVGSVPLPLPLPMELGVPLDWRLFALTLSMVVIATLASGVLPALSGSRDALSPALKQTERAYVHRRWTLRGLLVIGQVTLSVGLVVTALLFVRNLSLARTSSPGFDTAQTVVAQLGLVESRYTPETRVAFLQQAVERVEALPGVERAAFAFGMPLSIRHGRTSGARLDDRRRAGHVGVPGVVGREHRRPGVFRHPRHRAPAGPRLHGGGHRRHAAGGDRQRDVRPPLPQRTHADRPARDAAGARLRRRCTRSSASSPTAGIAASASRRWRRSTPPTCSGRPTAASSTCWRGCRAIPPPACDRWRRPSPASTRPPPSTCRRCRSRWRSPSCPAASARRCSAGSARSA